MFKVRRDWEKSLGMIETMSSRAIASDEDPPSKKPAIEPIMNLPLPHDLVLSCLARVSRLHHPILSLVSKTFRSLTSSPDLYHTRSVLNLTETCLYVCLKFPNEPNLRWFTLSCKPDKTLNNNSKNNNNKKKKKTSSGYVLAPVQILNTPDPLTGCSNLVAVGHKLYAISDVTYPCNVFFLDCRTHTWVKTPTIRLAHIDKEINGMIYLPGINENHPGSLNCSEVFDVETQTWNQVPPEKRIFREGDFHGKIYKTVAVESNTCVVAMDGKDFTAEFIVPSIAAVTLCLIDNIFFGYKSNGGFEWSYCGPDQAVWRKVNGLEGVLPKFAHYCNVYSVVCGGNMVLFWDKYVPSRGGYKEKVIWCAEISFEMRSGEEVWGNVEWFDAVLTVPKSYKFVYASAATV